MKHDQHGEIMMELIIVVGFDLYMDNYIVLFLCVHMWCIQFHEHTELIFPYFFSPFSARFLP